MIPFLLTYLLCAVFMFIISVLPVL